MQHNDLPESGSFFLLLFCWLKVLFKQFETSKPHLSWEEEDVLVSLHYTSHQHMAGNERAPGPSWKEQSQLLLPSHLVLPWTQHLRLLCPSPKQMCNMQGPPQAVFIKQQPNNLKYLSWKLLCGVLGMAVLSLAAIPDKSWWTEPWEGPWEILEPNKPLHCSTAWQPHTSFFLCHQQGINSWWNNKLIK